MSFFQENKTIFFAISFCFLSFYIFKKLKLVFRNTDKLNPKIKNNNGLNQNIYGNGNTIYTYGENADLSKENTTGKNEKKSIEIQKNINILFIDDEEKSVEDFAFTKLLRKHGYSNVHKINDVDHLHQPEITSAQFIFVDITGVGSALGCREGTEIAVRIQKTFPDKIVAIYSSTEKHNILVKDLDVIKYRFRKNDDFQIFLDFIEEHEQEN